MKPSVYLETTIISYLAARPSRDLIVAAHQQITYDWWANHSERYSVFVSELVVREVSGGDGEAAARRLDIIRDIPSLEATITARLLAQDVLRGGYVPPRSADDAAHIALAAVHGMEYLLTWNCAHLANATARRNVELYLMQQGYKPPIICTPADMLEE